MIDQRLRLKLCGTSLVPLVVGFASPATADQLVIAGKLVPSPELTIQIAAIAEDFNITVAKGQSLSERLIEQCGANLTYLRLAQEHPELAGKMTAVADAPTNYDVPACIQPGGFGEVDVASGDNAIALAKRYQVEFWPDRLPQKTFKDVFATATAEASAQSTHARRDSWPQEWATTAGDGGESPISAGGVVGGRRPASVSIGGGVVIRDISAPMSFPKTGAKTWEKFEVVPQSQPDIGSPQWKSEHQRFAATTNRIAFQSANELNPELTIQAGGTVDIPSAVPKFQSVILKSGAAPEQIAAAVDAAKSEGAVESATAVGEVRLLSDVGATQCGTPPAEGTEWPYDRFKLIQQMGLNSAVSKSWQNSAVMIVDTGFPTPDGSTQPQNFWASINRIFPVTNRHQLFSSDDQPDGVAFSMRLSDNALNPGIMENFAGDKGHGMAVGMVAIGGAGLEPIRHLIQGRPSVSFISLLKSEGATVRVDAATFPQAIGKALGKRVPVVNVSYLEPGEANTSNALDKVRNGSLLVVAAAGNDGRDMDREDTQDYPLQAGGDPANGRGAQVITVGATDFALKPHPKSRKSVKYLDFFAPGCGIPTYSYEIDTATKDPIIHRIAGNGTSFAAPLASFAATLLSGYGFNPTQIKSRLQYTVDVDPAYESVSFSPGVLNIPRALAFPFDVYEVKTASGGIRTAYSRDGVNQEFAICGNKFMSNKLGRVAIVGSKMFYWRLPSTPADKPLDRYKSCDLTDPRKFAFEPFKVRDFLSDDEVEVTRDNLVSYTGSLEN